MHTPETPHERSLPPERHKGPVVLRRKQLHRRTSDQRFLDQRPAEPDDFTRTDPWRVLRIQAEFVEGFDALANLGPAVSVFGSRAPRRGTRSTSSRASWDGKSARPATPWSRAAAPV